MSRKQIVAIPLIMIASWALRPMTSGKTKVAPNIATTCWAPRPIVLPHDSRLVRGDDVVGAHRLAVPVQFPAQAQSHSDSYGCPMR